MPRTMTKLVAGSVALAVTIACSPADAQSKRPAAAASPHLDIARKAADAAFKSCKGIAIAVAVLDSDGGLKFLANADGSPGLFAEFAQRKAMTALTFNKPSSQVRDEAVHDPALAMRLRNDPKLIGFGGGLPLSRNGRIWGAVAVAGAPDQEIDIRCATAAQSVFALSAD